MRIGIDIDNVISNFDEQLLKEFFKHNKELGHGRKFNKDADYITKGMFFWGDDEVELFYKNNIERIAKKLRLIKGSKKYISKLKNDGHEIFIITGRCNGEYTNPKKLTENWLKKNKIYYDTLIFTDAYDAHAKAEECIKNHIDIMIDDSGKVYLSCQANGINALLMDTPYNKQYKNVERVYNWKEIHKHLSN